MKSRFFLLLALVSLMSVVSTLAADAAAQVAGKWSAQVPGRGGQTREAVFNFQIEGEKLTGTMSGMQGAELTISEGVVKGEEISFSVTQNFQGNQVKLVYKGKVSGNEIQFTRTREGGGGQGGQAQTFTAKRAQ